MPGFEDFEAELDAGVREHLGDSISYQRAGQPAVIRKGFITRTDGSGDPQRGRWQIEIDIAELPGGAPVVTDRIRHAKFGAHPVRPSVDTITREGGTYAFEIQAVAR